MKKIVFLLAVITALWACNKTPRYTISGHLDGTRAGMVFLSHQKDGKVVHVDSTENKDGNFTMTGTLDHPDIYYLQVKDKRGYLLLFLENSNIKITGNVDSLWFAKAEGSPYQDDYNAYQELLKPYEAQYKKLYGMWQQAKMLGNKAMVKQVEAQYDSVGKQQQEVDKKFMEEHPNSLVSPYLLRSLAYDMEGEEIENYLSQMDTSFRNIEFVETLKEWAAAKKRVAIGRSAIDFTLNDTTGHPVTLSDLYGNYILIDFWAAWCSPCRAENPNLVKTFKKYHKKGFDVIGVSLDDNKKDWVEAIQKDGLLWTQVSDLKGWKADVAKMYGVRSIPSNFLLDKDGKVIGKNLRGDALKEKLSELLD